jgi:aryl-alcohol dehydrogenase-like predicted oxidoreductase
MVVSTKCGETWSPDGGSVVDHSRSALAASVANSVELLGRIDLLQLHQASADVLIDPAIIADLRELQTGYNIGSLGASVKDIAAADTAFSLGVFTHLQMPINDTRPDLAGWAREHQDAVIIIGNRPFASGQGLDRPGERLAYAAAAVGGGVVLTGTTNAEHLDATVSAWNAGPPATRPEPDA